MSGTLISHMILPTSQALVDGVESHKGDMERTVKALAELTTQHKQLLEPTPIDNYRAALDRRWKALGKEVSGAGGRGGVDIYSDFS